MATAKCISQMGLILLVNFQTEKLMEKVHTSLLMDLIMKVNLLIILQIVIMVIIIANNLSIMVASKIINFTEKANKAVAIIPLLENSSMA